MAKVGGFQKDGERSERPSAARRREEAVARGRSAGPGLGFRAMAKAERFAKLGSSEALDALASPAPGSKQIRKSSAKLRAALLSLDGYPDGTVRDHYRGVNVPADARNNPLTVEHVLPKCRPAGASAGLRSDGQPPYGAHQDRAEGIWAGVAGTSGMKDRHSVLLVDAKANSVRGSFPFGAVAAAHWEQDGAKLGTDHAGRWVFEPPDAAKGIVARALLHQISRQALALPTYELEAALTWNEAFRPLPAEKQRNGEIELHQGWRNLLVDFPWLAEKISEALKERST